MTSLASSRPAVDEPERVHRHVMDDDSDTQDADTSSGRRSRMTTVTSVDDNDDASTLDACTVELEMDSRDCTLHHGIRRLGCHHY